jgi:hypothetical protein
MFADPITVTVNSVAKNLVRINQDTYGSEYFLREATMEWRLKIRNTSYTKAGVLVDRHNFEFTNLVYATSTAPAIERKIYLVFEVGRSDTDAAALQAFNGFVAFCTSANLAKGLNYES